MKTSTRRTFLQSLCLGGLAQGVSHAAEALDGGTDEPRGRFTVFDGLLFRPMPDLRSLGMPKLLSVGNVWRPKVSHQELDPIGMGVALNDIQRLSRDVYFDLEEWTLYGQRPDVDARIEKHVRAAEIARESTPALRFGFYGVVPTAPYWPIVLNKTDELAAWRTLNKRSRVIADKVDYLFPSLYTFYDDPKGWELTSRVILQEARQLGKPVYPFLWFEFHDGTKLQFQKIPREFWRRQLEVCREYADGLVLWGGFNGPWDEEAPWWLETKAFVSSLPGKQGAPAAARLSRIQAIPRT